MWLAAALALASTTYQHPPDAIRAVLNADPLPLVRPSGQGGWLLLATPVSYPPIADKSAPMLPLAGVRVDPRTGGRYMPATYRALDLQRVEDGRVVPVAIRVARGAPPPGTSPAGEGLPDARVTQWMWSPDERTLVVQAVTSDHVGLWVVSVDGEVREVPDLAVVPILGSEWSFGPRGTQLLVKMRPAQAGPPPGRSSVPIGPIARSSEGVEVASSTYEARDLLVSADDDASFAYYATSQLAWVDLDDLEVHPIGAPGVYGQVEPSPDGRYLLVDTLSPPWSHRVGWWSFARTLAVWDKDGTPRHTIATLPAAEAVPINGVRTGPRDLHWRPDAPATLAWSEALDGGDPSVKVPYRDQLVQLAAPFTRPPRPLMSAVHRVVGVGWTEDRRALVQQYEWERRWKYVWTVDADRGPKSASLWFDRSENDRYADPGEWLYRQQSDGTWVIDQEGEWVYFAGAGASPSGDRPFVDRRSLKTGRVERLFRSTADAHETYVSFLGGGHTQLLIRRQSPTEVPNVHLVSFGARTPAPEGEAQWARTDRAVTALTDPTPQIREITKRIVTYQRDDGVPLSFTLYLPPGYKEGTALPTVLWAYPREYSDARTAGQVSGSDRTFDRLVGASHLFFLLDGYAVLHNTTMPVLGDPVTAYDTFVDQLVRDASAAIDCAVALGVTDPDRVGVMGHSHGGLMAATLLAHSELFRAGIARSGAYNHTIRPFGFQNERRTLWEAEQTYLNLSPVLFAPQINEPLLLIHGAIDENPGTVPLQSERLFEAVRGTGGTSRLVLLPFEGHAYTAQQSVEHILYEQIAWFDRYVKRASPRETASRSGSE